MAVTTFGDILDQCLWITGIRESETRAVNALKAAINTAHSTVVLAGIADALPWMVKLGVTLDITATTTSVTLPDGSTVTDHDGNVPARMTRIFKDGVRLGATQVPLTWMPKHEWEAQHGSLASAGRGTPRYFHPFGYDSSGNGLMWLMPMPSGADTISIDGVAGLTQLTAPSQVLIPPPELRELVCQEAIAKVNAPINQGTLAKAEYDARRLWRLAYAASAQTAIFGSASIFNRDFCP